MASSSYLFPSDSHFLGLRGITPELGTRMQRAGLPSAPPAGVMPWGGCPHRALPVRPKAHEHTLAGAPACSPHPAVSAFFPGLWSVNSSGTNGPAETMLNLMGTLRRFRTVFLLALSGAPGIGYSKHFLSSSGLRSSHLSLRK